MKRDDGEPERERARPKNIKLDELSLVDKPANPHAKIVLAKRAGDDKETDQGPEQDRVIRLVRGRRRGDREGRGLPAPRGDVEGLERSCPDLLEKFQRAGDEMIAKAADAARPTPVSKAELAFDDKVDEIAKSRGVPRSAAMSLARQRFAEEFEAAYGREP